MKAEIGRLRRRPEFLRVAGTRQKAVAPGLVLQARYRKTDPTGPATATEAQPPQPSPTNQTRIGFTASRKVGSAVERNRARRRLREAAAEMLPRHAKPGYDFVLIARRTTLTRPFPKLLDDLKHSLKKLGAYHE